MSRLNAFFKANKKKRENVFYAASEDFLDENGKPIEWEIKAITSKEADNIRDLCSSVDIKTKTANVDRAKFTRMMAAACTVFPDLNDVQLQDSYGVVDAGDLLMELLSNDGEYQAYCKKVMEVSGYGKSDAELIEEAKK